MKTYEPPGCECPTEVHRRPKPYAYRRAPGAACGNRRGSAWDTRGKRRHREFSSEITRGRRPLRVSRAASTSVEGREYIEGRLRSTRDALHVETPVELPQLACVREFATRAPGFVPFLGSGGRPGPGRIWRPRRVWARTFQGIVAIVGHVDTRASGKPAVKCRPPSLGECSLDECQEGQVFREEAPAAREEQTSEGQTPRAPPA